MFIEADVLVVCALSNKIVLQAVETRISLQAASYLCQAWAEGVRCKGVDHAMRRQQRVEVRNVALSQHNRAWSGCGSATSIEEEQP